MVAGQRCEISSDFGESARSEAETGSRRTIGDVLLIMPTPKEAFIATPHRQDWERITQTKAAEAARDAALLQFVYDQPDANAPAASWDAHSQLVGARKMLNLLFNLHLKEEPRTPMKLTHLPIPK